MKISVLYEDKNLAIINKPSGLLVHANVKENQESTLVDWLVKKYPEIKSVGDEPEIRPGIVHRLDKETSGVMVIAKNQQAFEHLKKQFQEKAIQKTYSALVKGRVKNESGTIEKPIGLKSGTTKRTVWVKDAKMIKDAVTDYKVEKRFKDFTLLEVTPRTGRTHQIRVHLNAIGHPVVGDKLYGKNTDLLDRHFLHAHSISFTAPGGQKLKITADLPAELMSFLKQLSPEDSQS